MKKIACIGSATMDVMVSPVDEMPPAGTLYAVENTSRHPGGCAVNVAMDLGKLGFSAGAFCMFGKDSFGDILTQKLSCEGVDVQGIVYTEKGDYILCLFYNGNTASQEEYDALVLKETLIEKEIERLKNTNVGANKEIQAFLESMGSSTLKTAATLAELICQWASAVRKLLLKLMWRNILQNIPT